MNLCRAVMLEYLAYTPSASRKHCVPKLVLSSSTPFRPNIHSFHLIGWKAALKRVSLSLLNAVYYVLSLVVHFFKSVCIHNLQTFLKYYNLVTTHLLHLAAGRDNFYGDHRF